MSHAKPHKLRSGEWGISTFDLAELERGTLVRIHTRDDSYIVSIRNLVWMGKNDDTGKDIAYYGVTRLTEDNCCPVCGAEIDLDAVEDFGKPTYQERNDNDDEQLQKRSNGYRNGGGGQRAGGKAPPKKRAASKGKPQSKQEDFDDEIPF